MLCCLYTEKITMVNVNIIQYNIYSPYDYIVWIILDSPMWFTIWLYNSVFFFPILLGRANHGQPQASTKRQAAKHSTNLRSSSAAATLRWGGTVSGLHPCNAPEDKVNLCESYEWMSSPAWGIEAANQPISWRALNLMKHIYDHWMGTLLVNLSCAIICMCVCARAT